MEDLNSAQNRSNEERQDQGIEQLPQKSKKIGKKSNAGRPSKKKKNSAIIDQRLSSRLSQSTQHTSPLNCSPFQSLCDKITNHFIDFFEHTKQRKGFVYAKDDRVKLIKFIKQVKWNEEDKWNPSKEQQKIDLLISGRNFTESSRENISKVMLETSGQFAEQFTLEYYEIILQLYSHMLAEKQGRLTAEGEGNPFDNLADSIYANRDNKYFFFSYSFRTLVKLKQKEQFQKPQTSHRHRVLIAGIRQQLLNL